MHNECRPLQGHCTGHWVEAATSPHTTASIINLVHLCPDNQYDSSIEILYLVHKESLFIFLTSQNKHLFVCLYYPHIGNACTGHRPLHRPRLGLCWPVAAITADIIYQGAAAQPRLQGVLQCCSVQDTLTCWCWCLCHDVSAR